MRLNQTLLKAAQLGLHHFPFDETLFPPVVRNALKEATEEEKFLDATLLYLTYTHAGEEIASEKGLANQLPTCEEESFSYAMKEYEDFLRRLLESKDESFSVYFPQLAKKLSQNSMVLSPEMLISTLKRLPKHQKPLISAFGKRSEWIASFERGEETPFSEMKAKERRDFFLSTLKNEGEERAIEVIGDIFESETLSAKFAYLKEVHERYTPHSLTLLDFFSKKFSALTSKSKTLKEMRGFLELLYLNTPESDPFLHSFETLFSQLFQKVDNRLTLRETTSLRILFRALEEKGVEDFYDYPYGMLGIDKYLYFVIASVPVSFWCARFDLSLEDVIESVSEIKTIDSVVKADNAMEYFNFLEALSVNVIKYAQQPLAKALFEKTKMKYLDPMFLRLFDKSEALSLIQKKRKLFSDVNLISFIVDD